MKTDFTVIAKFRDDNMPDWKTTCETEALAMTEVLGMRNRIAGLKSLAIQRPTGERDVFTPSQDGVQYLFTVPKL